MSKMNRYSRCFTAAAVLCSLSLSTLAGCSATKPAQAPANAPAAVTISEQAPRAINPMSELGYTLSWKRFDPTGGSAGQKDLSLQGSTLVHVDTNNIMRVIDRASGRTRWSSKLGNRALTYGGATELLAQPLGSVLEGQAPTPPRLVAITENRLITFDLLSGEQLDQVALDVQPNTPPVGIGDQTLAFGTSSGEVWLMDMNRNYKLWAYAIEGIIETPLTVSGNDVAAVSTEGDFVVVELSTGSARGRRGRVFDAVTHAPLLDVNGLYLASKDQSVWAFVRSSSKQLWRERTPFPLTNEPALHAGTLYVSIPSRGLVAFNALSGEVLWENQTFDSAKVIGLRNGRVLTKQGTTLALLEAGTGRTTERVTVPTLKRVFTDSFVDADLYVEHADGTIERYRPGR